MPGFILDTVSTVWATVMMASFNASSRATNQPGGVKPIDLDTSRANANSNWLASNSTMTCTFGASGAPVSTGCPKAREGIEGVSLHGTVV